MDATHLDVVAHLRAQGWSVVSLASQGSGVPDLLVGARGETFLVEVKTPSALKRPNNPSTAARQALWRARWRGSEVIVASSGPDAVEALRRALAGQ